MRLVSEKSSDIYVRDESGLHIAPTWVIATMPVFFLALVSSLILIIMGIFLDISRSVLIVSYIVFFISVFWGTFCDVFFEYQMNCTWDFSDKSSPVFRYRLNSTVALTKDPKVSVKVKELDRVKVRKNEVVLFGIFTKKAPMQRDKTLHSVKLKINFIDRDSIIARLNEIKRKEN